MMFGNFMQNFGLDFPLQQADAQGGLFGPNAPTPDATLGGPAAPGGAGTGLNMHPPASTTAPAPAGGISAPPATANAAGATGGQPAAPAPSPLASPMAAGQLTAPGLLQPPRIILRLRQGWAVNLIKAWQYDDTSYSDSKGGGGGGGGSNLLGLGALGLGALGFGSILGQGEKPLPWQFGQLSSNAGTEQQQGRHCLARGSHFTVRARRLWRWPRTDN